MSSLESLGATMRRREFISLIASATAWPLAARAQQPTLPVVGFLNSTSLEGWAPFVAAFRQGLKVGPKRLELARELFPGATTVALLVNPANPLTATVSKDLQAVADTLGVRLLVLHASTEADFEAAFATAAQLRAAALVIEGSDPWFASHAAQLGALALQHSVPAIYQFREFAAAGGLMSYGGSITDTYGHISSGRRLRRPNSEGRKTGRPAGPTGNQGRAVHQHEDRQRARRYNSVCHCPAVLTRFWSDAHESGFT
jgi:putative ABC transport system substrate-binding protein